VQISENLQRMRELSVQSANATNSSSDRQALQKEITALSAEVDRIANQSSFNGQKLLNGTFTNKSFQVGANAGETIQVTNIASATATSIGGYKFSSTAVTAGALAAGDLSIKVGDASSVTVGASTAGAGAGQSAGSAWAKAQAINAANAGVTATASTTVEGQAIVAAATGPGTISINGIATAQFSTINDAAVDASSTISAINAISDRTGVTASGDATTGVKLTAADGRDIKIEFATLTSAATGVKAANTYGGTLELTSSSAAVMIGGAAGGPAKAGLSDGAAATTLSAVSAIDIGTQDGASKSIAVLDAALQSVNNTRASLGAIQNRFASVVSSLQVASENLSSSRGRIVDADFAQETANLTRGQILQQAGTAMLAQANGLPQNVLSLLRG